MGPEDAVTHLAADPNHATPVDAAVFVKTDGRAGGDAGRRRVCGAYARPVGRPGPGDRPHRHVHPVRDARRAPGGGQIEFRARRVNEGEGEGLHFEIESWARPGDRLSHLLYNRLLLAKEIQLNLWTETCLGVVRGSGGRLVGGVRVHTRRVDEPVPES